MNKKSLYLFYLFSALFALLVMQVVYLNNTKAINKDMLNKKETFIHICGLPDLAISTEASYVRHRSLSDLFSIYKDDGNLREYFPSTFAYSHSHLINISPVKTANEK